jgi:hypothetical protein
MPRALTRIDAPRLESAAVFTTAALAGADDGRLAGVGPLLEELEALPQALNSTDAARAIVGMRKFFEERIVRLLCLAIELRSPSA